MKYKWREYCEDDSEFGLDPQWFELESDYEKALDSLKIINTRTMRLIFRPLPM